LLGLLSAIAGSVTATGCRPDRAPESGRTAGTVRVYLSADPASMSLLGKTDANAAEVAAQISDSLVQFDPELRLQPRVAESWSYSDDRKTLTFRLREGVRWHDGRDVTADDVVFTIEKLLEPQLENRVWAPQFSELESIEAPDARTVVARFSRAIPGSLEAWRVPLIPRHVAGDDENFVDGEFAAHPVGCGPFRFVSYERGNEIVLAANPDYWDGPPRMERLVYRIFPDQRTAYQSMIKGDLDLMTLTPNLWREARSSERAAHLEPLLFYRYRLWFQAWRQDGSNPFFSDARVRRALVLALDRERFIESVLDGLARVGINSYTPDPEYADPSIEPVPFDPRQARQLLDEAGWIDRDGDGLRDRDGVPFRFELLIPATAQNLPDQLAAWQQQSWAEIGVATKITKLEWQAFRERRNAGNFQSASFTLNLTPDPDQFDLYHSSAVDGGYNFGALDDPEIDRLLELGRETFDVAERRRIYSKLQRRLAETEPVTVLFHFATPMMHTRGLQGIVTSPVGYALTTEGPRRWSWSDDVMAQDRR
jgi:peptide/nickel transport system substrate-binding protein